jgi:UPF0755 protein
MRKILLSLLVVVSLAVAAFVAAALEGHRRFTAPGPLTAPLAVVIPKGVGIEAVSHILADAGVIREPWVLMVGAKLHGAHPKAGEFLFPAAISTEQALMVMVEGRTVIHKLTIAEGLTVRAVLDVVQDADFLAGAIVRRPAEGTLLPETWHLSRDDSRDDLVGRMEKSMQQALDAAWAKRAPGLPLKSKAEALVLASIVERETGIASERPHVAAVFENRLKKGMRLQSDPTVIYGLSDGWGVLDRPLTHDDLVTAHPWNTYVIDALPVTPIANPGKASLEAVMHPAASDDLYFVADGTGGHVFARTLDDHNANVAHWRRLERERRER